MDTQMPRRRSYKLPRTALRMLLPLVLTTCILKPARAEINIVYYHLRDRAVVLDTLELRKRAIFAFKSTRPLDELVGARVTGELACAGRVLARDTTWLFDQAAGNLAFCLLYHVPDSVWSLAIRVTDGNDNLLESFNGDFERRHLRPYFQRGINFWDFTTPYAHLQCAGHGELTYRFRSDRQISISGLELSARMTSDSELPARTVLSVNGVEAGVFDLPAPSRETDPEVVTWKTDAGETNNGPVLRRGENTLSFSIPAELNPEGMGIRIFAKKNSSSADVEEGKPIELRVSGEGDTESFTIPVWGEDGENITARFLTPEPAGFTEESDRPAQEPLPLEPPDIGRGYVVFSRPWLSYVYPWTVPASRERAGSLNIRMARNDFEPLTFSLYPVRDLGEVRVSVGEFRGPGGAAVPFETVVHVARTMKIRRGGTSYRLVPRLLERTDRAAVPLGYTTRFWITLHAAADAAPGRYSTSIRIEPQNELATEIPVEVEILPVRLEPVPGIAYSMFMTYEFFELDSKDWSESDREKIYRDGVNVFRDFRNHGLTTVDVSSPFYFQWNRDGTPRMEHFKGMIRGAREANFEGPLFWYFAHYLQAAKKQHPGNVLLYDPAIHPRRAKMLVETALRLARELDGPPVYFVPIDEPRIASRQEITLELFEAIKQIEGVRIMSSTDIGGSLLDIENNSSSHARRLGPGEHVRHSDREVWEYHNSAITCLNPGFSRYMYGYYTWRQDLDGMNSWGFNTAENSRGHPYEDLDHTYSDWNLAYPHEGGPLPTPNWEAVREGIDDVRYVYQLEKLISRRKESAPRLAAGAAEYLDRLRALCDIDERSMIDDPGPWTPEAFAEARNRVIGWIARLQED